MRPFAVFAKGFRKTFELSRLSGWTFASNMSPFRSRTGVHSFSGFTLMEMIVVLVVIGTFASMAVPGWKRITWKLRAGGAIDEFRNAVMLAKSDAKTRRHCSGIFIDADNSKYLRFVDSNDVTGAPNGLYDAKEKILQGWTKFPPELKFEEVASSISPQPSPRVCGQAASVASVGQSGSYSVVFRPDGTSWATLAAKLTVRGFPKDTFRLSLFPTTGLLALGR